MIRPLTSEEELQNLEKKDLSELRTEFADQVMTLRRKVLNRVKPKLLNGKQLNGSMLAGLVESYVKAINSGVVPNIQNAWTYICQNECQKGLDTALKIFTEEMGDSFNLKAPMFEDELKEIYKEAKKFALEKFDEISLGDSSLNYKDELKFKFKQQFDIFKAENERASHTKAQAFLQNYFAPIETKMRNNGYEQFSNFERDINEFQLVFMEEGPPGPHKKELMLEFCIGSLSEACSYFLRTAENDTSMTKQMNDQTVSKLEEKIVELKEELIQTKTVLENKMRSLETDKAHLEAREQTLQEHVEQIKTDKEKSEVEFKQRLSTEKKEGSRMVEEYKTMAHTAEENSKALQRQVMSSESEFDKQKALLDQKIEHLDSIVETQKQKEKEYSSELKSQKKELMSTIKEAQSKNEAHIKTITEKLDISQETLIEKEGELAEKEQKWQIEKTKIHDQLQKQGIKLTEQKQQIDELQEQNQSMNAELSQTNQVEMEKLIDEKEELQQTIDEVEGLLKAKDEELRSSCNKKDKDDAITSQKLQFLELQLQEAKSTVEDNRNTHSQMISAYQSRENDKGKINEEADKRVEDIRGQHTKEMDDLDTEYNQQRQRLSEKLEKSQLEAGEMKTQFKIKVNEQEKEIEILTESVAKLTGSNEKLESDKSSLETTNLELIENNDTKYQTMIKDLEGELQEKEDSMEREKEEAQRLTEESLAQLKNFYEIEKERLENRITQEKETHQKRLFSLQEEYETRFKDDQNQQEDDLEMVQEELREKEIQFQAISSQYEHENSLQVQKIESLEENLKETKCSLSRMQELQAEALETQKGNYTSERKELLEKIDQLQQKVTEKEREFSQIQNTSDNTASKIKSKDKELEEIKAEFNTEKTSLNEKIDELREKYSNTSDELVKAQLGNERESALTN